MRLKSGHIARNRDFVEGVDTKAEPHERTNTGVKFGAERSENFLIPLNVDLGTTQLDWMTSDLNYISFSNWANGYAALLHTLTKMSTPRPLDQQGPNAAIETFRSKEPLRNEEERLLSTRTARRSSKFHKRSEPLLPIVI